MKLLITCPKFFGYELLIKKEAERLGYKTTFLDDRLGLNFFEQALIRKNIFTREIKLKLYRNVKKRLSDEIFDYWLCINPEGFDIKIIKYISSKVNYKKIVYCWDSLANKPNQISIINLFDKRYSFDILDCKKHNLIHLPLYYSKNYYYRDNKIKNKKIYTIGSVHSDRIKIINTLLKNKFNIEFSLFSKNVFLTIYFFLKGIIPLNYIKNISYDSTSHDDIFKKYNEYNFILDISHPLQTGLTNRTFEVLASGCSLITTNPNIIKYDFYNPLKIFILKRDFSNLAELNNWITNYNNLKLNMDNYTLNNWLIQLLK
ncbi:MAG: hypothetical protein CMG00_05875 [Candidatus Marinimicrobia bacterium]|nr:hypothetical protein [Candidatus Neomarinimicrobiota bacterium]